MFTILIIVYGGKVYRNDVDNKFKCIPDSFYSPLQI